MMKANLSNASSSTRASSLSYSRDDEVNLMELWCILIKRKGLILAILVLSLVAAGLLIHFTPSVYESHAVLRVGQIGQVGQIEPSMELAKRLMAQKEEITSEGTEKGKTRSFIQTASVENGTNLISITARGATPDATQKYLTQVVEKVMNEHQELFDSGQKEQQLSLNLLQARVHGLSHAIDALDKEIYALGQKSTNANPTATFLGIYLVPERSKMFEQRMLLEQKLNDLRVAMSGLHSKPTVLIARPSLSDSPVKPRPPVYFVLAISAGLVLGIASAFVAEFISRARNELKEKTQK